MCAQNPLEHVHGSRDDCEVTTVDESLKQPKLTIIPVLLDVQGIIAQPG